MNEQGKRGGGGIDRPLKRLRQREARGQVSPHLPNGLMGNLRGIKLGKLLRLLPGKGVSKGAAALSGVCVQALSVCSGSTRHIPNT